MNAGFDPALLRHALARFATGITVVTVHRGTTLHGMTANAFASVSLSPPFILVSIAHSAVSYRMIQDVGWFGINVLGTDQRPLSDRFAGRGPSGQDDFSDIALHFGPHGEPLFDHCLMGLACRLDRVLDVADHGLVIGEITALHLPSTGSSPLLFFDSRYRSIGGEPPQETEVPQSNQA